MATTEILTSFMKGNEFSTISDKQRDWLLSQAKRDGFRIESTGFNHYIYLTGCLYKIEQCKTVVSGYGGTRGTKPVNNKHKIEKMYSIKFDSTGLTGIYRLNDLNHFRSEGHKFQIV